MEQRVSLIVIGGSWGGIQASIQILKDLPADFSIPIVLVLHRLKNVDSGLHDIYAKKLKLKVLEVEEKESLVPGHVYVAPPNYHVLIEKDLSFSLDSSELENYSRPSIDVTFSSAADAVKSKTVGIILSGASRDGSKGLQSIAKKGGIPIVQDPMEAEVDTMPRAAIEITPDCRIFTLQRIKDFLLLLNVA